MKNQNPEAEIRKSCVLLFAFCLFTCLGLCGCKGICGYSNESLFPQDVNTVCLEMFDNRTFRRGVEYELSDALAKRIEADTPYKIVSSADRADTVMNGQIVSITESALSLERELGRVLEKEVEVRAVVNWKNLKTGELLIANLKPCSKQFSTKNRRIDGKKMVAAEGTRRRDNAQTTCK
ncbi:MAG: LptE family protein [Planctomycetota bacterium]|nr:LptE family protein [Planctomycetota bacterium]